MNFLRISSEFPFRVGAEESESRVGIQSRKQGGGAEDKKSADIAPILEEMLARIELMCNFTPQNKNKLL